jgi:phospholipase C
VRLASWIALLTVSLGSLAHAHYPPENPIKHVVVIVQENRTPDNLFQGLCSFGAGCGNASNQYNISST